MRSVFPPSINPSEDHLRQVVHSISDRSTEQSRDGQGGPLEGVGVSVHGWRAEMPSEGKGQRKRGQDGLGGQFILFQLGLLQSFGFRSSVLEPDLHLRLRQVK